MLKLLLLHSLLLHHSCQYVPNNHQYANNYLWWSFWAIRKWYYNTLRCSVFSSFMGKVFERFLVGHSWKNEVISNCCYQKKKVPQERESKKLRKEKVLLDKDKSCKKWDLPLLTEYTSHICIPLWSQRLNSVNSVFRVAFTVPPAAEFLTARSAACQ